MAEMMKGPDWLMSPGDKKRAQGIYLTLETVSFEKKTSKLPIIMMSKWLEGNIPDTIEAKPIRDGKILLLAKNEEVARKAIKNGTKFYDKCEIKIARMENMNTCQGTVFGRSLLTESTEILMENLEEYKVLKIERIESIRDGKRSPNGLLILTFGTRTLPESVLCGFERFAVKQYYPNPLRCMVCCQYGHTKNKCKTKEQPICKDCGKTKHENEC
jgi:hypothetical protein